MTGPREMSRTDVVYRDGLNAVLRRVLVSFGEDVGFSPTLQESLNEVFQGEAGVETEEPDVVETDVPDEGELEEGAPPEEEAPEEEPPVDAEPPPATGGDTQALLNEAQQAFQDMETAQRNGDWSAYGEALDRLEQALNELAAASEGGGG